jgi:hypothetical protein
MGGACEGWSDAGLRTRRRSGQQGGMPAIVDHPDLVHQLVAASGDPVANQPERRHVAEYLTGRSVRTSAYATAPAGR